MTNWVEIGTCRLACGDCLEILPELEAGSIDAVVTDPPYGSGGRDGSVHLSNTEIAGNRKSSDCHIWTTRQYAQFCGTIVKPDAHAYVFSDWRRYLNVQIGFESVGWEHRALLVWDKGNGMGEFWRSCHEFILFLTHRSPRKLTHGACYNTLRFPRVTNSDHPAEKPVDLLKCFVKASTQLGEIILDPYMGSGATGGACIQTGRKFIGIEIEPKYFDIACRRIEAAVKNRQGKLF